MTREIFAAGDSVDGLLDALVDGLELADAAALPAPIRLRIDRLLGAAVALQARLDKLGGELWGGVAC